MAAIRENPSNFIEKQNNNKLIRNSVRYNLVTLQYISSI